MHYINYMELFSFSEIASLNTKKYVFCSFIIFHSNFLFLSLSPFSQVGWCREVQRVHDPDVLMAKPSHLD